MRSWRASIAVAASLTLVAGLALATTAEDDITGPAMVSGMVYGDEAPSRQVIHAYIPADREAPRPAVVFFHGGGLEDGEPLWDADAARSLAQLGYATFMAGYRLLDPLTGDYTWPAQLDDAQRAVRWIRAHADEYNVDPDRICAIGGSSGGHLASMVGVLDTRDDSDPELAGVSSRVDCVVTVEGVNDMTMPLFDEARTDWYEAISEAAIAEDPSLAVDASPVHHVDERTVPFLIIHGNRDQMVPIEQSRSLADALGAQDLEFFYAEIDAGRYDIPEHPFFEDLIEAFLAYQLHPER